MDQGTILGLISLCLTLYFQYKDRVYTTLKLQKTNYNHINMETY